MNIENDSLQLLENEENFKFDTVTADLIVIDFWHVKCPQCIPALGKFIHIYEKNNNDSIQFITCSLNIGDCSKENSLSMLDMLEDTEIINLFACDKESIKQTWNITSVPHCVVMRRNHTSRNWELLLSGNPNRLDFELFLTNLSTF